MSWEDLLHEGKGVQVGAKWRNVAKPVPMKDVTDLFRRGDWDRFMGQILFWGGVPGAEKRNFFAVWHPPGYPFPFVVYYTIGKDSLPLSKLRRLRKQNPAVVFTPFDESTYEGGKFQEFTKVFFLDGVAVPMVAGISLDSPRWEKEQYERVEEQVVKGPGYMKLLQHAANGKIETQEPPTKGLEPLPTKPRRAPRRKLGFDRCQIKVSLTDPKKGRVRKSVEAWCFQGYAVHKPYRTPEEQPPKGLYVVTHPGSGLAALRLEAGEGKALRAVKRLAEKWGPLPDTKKAVEAYAKQNREWLNDINTLSRNPEAKI
jgi:hypothetical protein